MGQFIDLTAADGQKIPAYVAKPEGQPRGAVVVVQEIFGVNAHIREVADGYAKDGYLAVAPSTFQRVKPGVDLGYTDADMQEGFGYKNAVEALPAPGVMQDIQAAIELNTELMQRLGAEAVPFIVTRHAGTGETVSHAGSLSTEALASLIGLP